MITGVIEWLYNMMANIMVMDQYTYIPVQYIHTFIYIYVYIYVYMYIYIY